MANSAANKAFVARSAAILTTGEVAASRLDLNLCWGGLVSVDVDFTLGSLTNGILRFYVSADGTTYKPIAIGGIVSTETITADATRAYIFPALPGWKWFRATIQGTGTVTSSSATITYRRLAPGSQV
jgi:hypothetical protein